MSSVNLPPIHPLDEQPCFCSKLIDDYIFNPIKRIIRPIQEAPDNIRAAIGVIGAIATVIVAVKGASVVFNDPVLGVAIWANRNITNDFGPIPVPIEPHPPILPGDVGRPGPEDA